MDVFHAPTLGLVELPDLGEVLRQLGYRVISGASFPEAASAIKTTLDAPSGDPAAATGPFPIVISDVHRPGIKAWAQKLSRTSPVLILRTGSEDYVTGEGIAELRLPTTVEGVLAALGMFAAEDQRAKLTVGRDGSISGGATAASPVAVPAAPQVPVVPVAVSTPDVPAAVQTAAPVEPTSDAPARAPWDNRPGSDIPEASLTAILDFERVPQTLFLDERAVGESAAPAAASPSEPSTPSEARTSPGAQASMLPRASGRRAAVPTPLPISVAPETSASTTAEPVPAIQNPLPFVERNFSPATAPESTAIKHTPGSEPTWAEVLDENAAAGNDTPVAFDWQTVVPDYLPEPVTSARDEVVAPVAAPIPSIPPAPVAAAAPVADEYPLNLDAAPCIFVWAAKGGVNKTSTALQLAHRAAEAGYRVWLVDMNRGQGGIRSALRVPDLAPIRSALDAARVGDPAQAFVKPAELQQHRAASLDPIKFGVVLAPPRAEADPSQVPYTAYRQIIEHARAHGDLVIVDTQTVEAIDISGLIDNVMVPAMIVNAHGVAVTEPGKESVDNIHAALSRYRLRGLTSDRQLLVVSRTNKFTDADAQAVAGKFAGLAHFVGSTAYSDEVKNQLDSGRVTSDEPAVRPLLNAVLRQVTGDKERFADAGRRPGKSPRGRRK